MKSADEMLEVDRASFWPRGLREQLEDSATSDSSAV